MLIPTLGASFAFPTAVDPGISALPWTYLANNPDASPTPLADMRAALEPADAGRAYRGRAAALRDELPADPPFALSYFDASQPCPDDEAPLADCTPQQVPSA